MTTTRRTPNDPLNGATFHNFTFLSALMRLSRTSFCTSTFISRFDQLGELVVKSVRQEVHDIARLISKGAEAVLR